MNLKKVILKSIASFMATTILFGNFSMCGIGISKVIAEDLAAPEIEFKIENSKYVQYSYTETVQEEVEGENEGEKVMQDVEKQIAGVAVQSKLSVKPVQTAETYLPTQSVNLSISMPKINEYLPVRATVVSASTEYTTGEKIKNINQSYDTTTGLLNVSYENVLDEQGNIYVNFNENAKDEFEIIYIYPAEAYAGNEIDTCLKYIVSAEMIFVTENGTITSQDEQTIDLTEKENKGYISNFKVTDLKENIYKGFMYSNIENGTSYDTEISTVSTFAVLNSEVAKEVLVEENANQLILKGEDEVVVSANENVVYNSTTILKSEFDKILGQENSFVEFYQGEEVYARVNYVNVGETKKIAVIYKDAEPSILEDGVNEIVINYPESTTNLKIKISKPIAEGFINFENQNKINAFQDYGYAVEDIKSILVTTSINENINETELILSEPSTKVGINSSNVNFSTLQQSSTTLTINLDDTNITTKLFNAPTLTVKLPEGIEKFDVTKLDILNGNGLNIKKANKENNIITIELEGKQTAYDLTNVSGGTNIVMDIDNIDYADTIPTHSDKIEFICSQDNVKAECNANIVSKPGLLTLANFSGYDNNGNVITNIDNTVKVVEVGVKEEAKEALYTLDLVNNYDENLTNVQILGKMGYSNNDLSSTFETIITRPIEINNESAKVYYSTKIDASYDDDSWQAEYTNQAKSYKVVLDNNQIEKASHISLKEYIQIPENLNVNEASFFNVNVAYNYKETFMQDNLIIGMETAKDELQVNSEQVNTPILSSDNEEIPVALNITPMIAQNYVHAKQLVTYKIEVTNNGDEDLTNLELKDIIPENAIYTNNEKVENPDLKEFTWEIELLRAGETKEFEIMLTMAEVSEEQEVVNEVRLIYNEQTISVESKLKLKPERKISARLGMYGDGWVELSYDEGSEAEYYVSVKNTTSNTIKNIKVEFPLPKELEFISGGLGDFDEFYGYSIQENGVVNNNKFEYTISKLAAESEKTIVIRCKVKRIEECSAKINAFANIYVENEVYQTNVRTIESIQAAFNIKLSSNVETGKILKENNSVEYTITVKNIGKKENIIEVEDIIPNEIIVKELIYYISGKEKPTKINTTNNEINVSQFVNVGETLIIKITGKVDNIESDTKELIQINNTASIVNYNIQSNTITLEIEPNLKKIEETEENGDNEEFLDDEDVPVAPNQSKEESGGNLEDGTQTDGEQQDNPPSSDDNTQNQGQGQQQDVNKYLISGQAWLDSNKNGQKDSDEKLIENIQVSLVDKSTGKFAVDEAGNKITVTTNSNGEYKFENVKEGTYIVVFEFDTNKYVVTTYQKTNINEDINSDAILAKVNIDEQNKLAGMTDKLELKSNKVNIDIGLMENAIFDLSLEKVITKVTVINAKGTETTEYEDGETAKVDLVAKYMNGAEVIVTYKFTIKNEGDTVGYVDKLVDNLPTGLEFSSELNSDWYKGSDNQLYTTTLSGKAIKPGETSEVELVLTKKMTESNTGVFPNNAELVEISNLENIKEKEDALDNNKSSAMLIISIKTGSVILYTGITISSILIIAAGAYIIKKKILNRGI